MIQPTEFPENASPAAGDQDRQIGRSRPRLGFLGVGWIGRNRLDAVARNGTAVIGAVADLDPAVARAAAAAYPGAAAVASLEELLRRELDGIVIATPTALHAAQAIVALESGLAVFCQKPLGRSAAETRRVVDVAWRRNRLLGVDMSYRALRAAGKIKQCLGARAIGEIYALDLVFHNAYGPDRPWYYDPGLSGGGCVIDLGVHLVDMALWLLDFSPVTAVTSRLYARGKPLRAGSDALEDYAVARLDFANGAVANLACSWRLSAGRDAVIRIALFGTGGGLAIRNVRGSFYDFRAERFDGTAAELLDGPPDRWSGRTAIAWAERLARGGRYSPEAEQAITVAEIVDQIYGRAGSSEGEQR